MHPIIRGMSATASSGTPSQAKKGRTLSVLPKYRSPDGSSQKATVTCAVTEWAVKASVPSPPVSVQR